MAFQLAILVLDAHMPLVKSAELERSEVFVR
jgi:hypothetical protein